MRDLLPADSLSYVLVHMAFLRVLVTHIEVLMITWAGFQMVEVIRHI